MSVYKHILVLLLWVAVVLVVLVEVNHAFHSISSSIKINIASNTRLKAVPLEQKKRYGLSGRYVKGPSHATPSIDANEISSHLIPNAYKGKRLFMD